jgi:hypothetical protein
MFEEGEPASGGADATGVDPARGWNREQASHCIGVEEDAKLLLEGGVAGVVGLGNDGEGLGLAEERFPVQDLLATDLAAAVIGGEDLVEVLVNAIASADVGVVSAVRDEEIFKGYGLRGVIFGPA